MVELMSTHYKDWGMSLTWEWRKCSYVLVKMVTFQSMILKMKNMAV